MIGHVLAVLGLALLCGAWVLVQRWIARRDPGAPTVDSGGGCRHHRRKQGASRVRHDPTPGETPPPRAPVARFSELLEELQADRDGR